MLGATNPGFGPQKPTAMKRPFPVLPLVALLAVATPAIGQNWSLTGNAGTNANINFIGTTDNKPLIFRINNERAGFVNGTNTSLGKLALVSNTTGVDNVAVGAFSTRYNTTGNGNAALGKNSLSSNTTGGDNVALGNGALRSNKAGSQITAVGSGALYYANSTDAALDAGNTAVGFEAMRGSSTASNNTSLMNTAVGHQALTSNTDGDYNAAFGAAALLSNTTGNYLCALGRGALTNNTTGTYNTGVGYRALNNTVAGNSNVALGANALYNNQDGSETVAIGARAMYYANNSSILATTQNVAVGYEALLGSGTASANTGIRNTAVGHQAMMNNSSGQFNVAMGTGALVNNTTGSYLCAVGRSALVTNTTGWSNTGVGYSANVSLGTLTNATVLGYLSSVTASNKVRLGNSAVTDVEGQVAYSWPSDGRFKRELKEDVPGLDLITRLRPVSYTFDRLAFAKHVKEDVEGREAELTQASQARTVGFIAQEVEATVKDLGYTAFDAVRVPENPTDNYSLAYAEFVVPLVKAVQELAAKNTVLEERNQAMEERLAALEQRSGEATGAERMNVHPVPASDLVRIELPARFNGKSGTLELRDAQGRSVDLQAIPSLGTVFELPLPAHLSEGAYTVVLSVAGEQPGTARVVIAR